MNVYKGYLGRRTDDGEEQIHYPITDSDCVFIGGTTSLTDEIYDVRSRLDTLEGFKTEALKALQELYSRMVDVEASALDSKSRLDNLVIPTSLPANGGTSEYSRRFETIAQNLNIAQGQYYPLMSVNFDTVGKGSANFVLIIDNELSPSFSYLVNLSLFGTGSDYYIDFSSIAGSPVGLENKAELKLAYNDSEFFVLYKSDNADRSIKLHTLCAHNTESEVKYYSNSEGYTEMGFKSCIDLN